MNSNIFSTLNQLISNASAFMSQSILLIVLVGTGIYLSIVLKGIQFTALKHAILLLFTKDKNSKAKGELSPFQALTAALSATIGTGNIAGVATAIAAGGPGAIFWMWVTAFVGMATKYSSSMLAVKYRNVG